MGQIATQDAVGGIKTFDKALAELSVRLGEAKEGGDKQIATFQKYGITLGDIAALNTEEMFYLIADRIAAIPDPAIRTAAAFELMGKTGKNLTGILSRGSAALKEMVDATSKVSEADIKRLAEGKQYIEESLNVITVWGAKALGVWAEFWQGLGQIFSGTSAADDVAGQQIQVDAAAKKKAAYKEQAVLDAAWAEEVKFWAEEDAEISASNSYLKKEAAKAQEELDKRLHGHKMARLKEEEAAFKRNLDWQKAVGDLMKSLSDSENSAFNPTLQELADFGGPFGGLADRALQVQDEIEGDKMRGNFKWVKEGQDELKTIYARMKEMGLDLDPNSTLRELLTDKLTEGVPVNLPMEE
jgi:hypothetical protein